MPEEETTIEDELFPEEDVTESTPEELTPTEPTLATTSPEEVVECPKCQTPMNKTDTGYACPTCGYFKAA